MRRHRSPLLAALVLLVAAIRPVGAQDMASFEKNLTVHKLKNGLTVMIYHYVQQFGLRLLPEIYEAYNPMSYDDARDMEVELAIDLREGGFGDQWQCRGGGGRGGEAASG